MNEMTKLLMALKALDIPHEVINQQWTGTPQIWYPNAKEPKMDIICHEYSYGGRDGLLEIMGLLTEEEAEYDSVVGYLTAENVLARILKDRAENKEVGE
jgi:hypothetical protein